jgi:outer membrane protein OmpA-like peptidoglycan-associated protein
MKKFNTASTHLTPILLAVAALVSACSSVPTTTSLLDQTRSDYRMAQANPAVVKHAPVELNQAGVALEQANAAANHNDSLEKIDQLAYVARQKIALSQEIARKKVAEADAATATQERSLVQLDQRTNEANKAKASADQSKADAQVAQGQAMDAQRSADEARRNADEARLKTENAQAVAQQTQMRNTQLEAQLADLAAKKTERGMVITLGDVLFGTDLARLSSDGVRTVQKLADVLQQNPQRRVLVEGFTDSTGTTAHNQELSERRATTVRAALQDMGVTRERVAIRGYGEAYPVASNDTNQNRQMNRRVEIVLSDDSGRTVQR